MSNQDCDRDSRVSVSGLVFMLFLILLFGWLLTRSCNVMDVVVIPNPQKVARLDFGLDSSGASSQLYSDMERPPAYTGGGDDFLKPSAPPMTS